MGWQENEARTSRAEDRALEAFRKQRKADIQSRLETRDSTPSESRLPSIVSVFAAGVLLNTLLASSARAENPPPIMVLKDFSSQVETKHIPTPPRTIFDRSQIR